jgi:UDP-sugar transporter A1/2/3
MTMEISSFSVVFLAMSMLVSDDGRKIREDGFWKGWTYQTWIPVLSNAAGGIIVGLVTKHAGSVQKGFALIFGLFLSGLFQARNTGITSEQVVGGILAAMSLWIHSSFPPVAIL